MTTKAKPKTKPTRPLRPKKAATPKAAPTRDELLNQMAPAFDALDTLMETRPVADGRYGQSSVRWTGYLYDNDRLYKPIMKLKALYQQLDEVERGKELDPSKPGAREAVFERFAHMPGEPLAWSRPGSFMAWIGDIPVRCWWGGYLLRDDSGFSALDATRLFIAGAGFRVMNLYDIPNTYRTPEALMKGYLSQLLTPNRRTGRFPTSPLELLHPEAKRAVAAFLADPVNAWWIEALGQSPEAAIPLPLNLPTVQTSLFS